MSPLQLSLCCLNSALLSASHLSAPPVSLHRAHQRILRFSTVWQHRIARQQDHLWESQKPPWEPNPFDQFTKLRVKFTRSDFTRAKLLRLQIVPHEQLSDLGRRLPRGCAWAGIWEGKVHGMTAALKELGSLMIYYESCSNSNVLTKQIIKGSHFQLI